MKPTVDGPVSSRFRAIPLAGQASYCTLEAVGVSAAMAAAAGHAPRGACVAWGIPFVVGDPVVVCCRSVTVDLGAVRASWLVFMHTSDLRTPETNRDGFISPMRGQGQLNELAARYLIVYDDGSEAVSEIRRRHQIGAFQRGWGENCFQAVAHHKPHPQRAAHEQLQDDWGQTQTRVSQPDGGPWVNWLWAWQNPKPDRAIVAIRFEPVAGVVVVAGLAAGNVSEQPLRWQRRRKALVSLPEGTAFLPQLSQDGLLAQVQIDLGQVISAQPHLIYPCFECGSDRWDESYNNQLPHLDESRILVEYTAHPDACFHLCPASDAGEPLVLPIAAVEQSAARTEVAPVAPATHRVALRVLDQATGRPVAVKLHVHGESGEYLAPIDRHRIINPAWFEDYSVDFANQGLHQCTYIPGETTVDVPIGRIFVEISKGFEIRPLRRAFDITPETEQIIVEVTRVLPWRERGWVTADTHVHFLSPMSALLEGAAEGVNIVNLLASQWGELMTNVGDYDGRMTWGSREAGGDGEYLVRVGTENRQHVMGHISLLGYTGPIIAPMTTGGPDESALGDPIEILLTEWARQCHKQGGVVVLPHFPNPRGEHAASIVTGDIDALEMTSWGDLYSGINPYSLADWYRYLNCGYKVAAVGGTDKMSANTAVGTVRTYAHVGTEIPFTYDSWMEAVRRAETFVTYGPLLEFSVDGHPMGTRIEMTATGGTVEVVWDVASVTIPLSRVELVVNGEIRESQRVDPTQASGSWGIRVDRSAWLALLVRGQYPDRPEIIAAHSSPVMIDVEGSQMLAAADAVTILEQIEGALAYLDTIGTRAGDRAYKRMRLVLESAHRGLHNRMHRRGLFHDHTPPTDHPEHH
ncbi:MAG: CehA/McbA family metallohydrolase [Anaerolineae bacterium]|nr:CehA/McbA family metallohydrolase [Anaerolineae bacterium]